MTYSERVMQMAGRDSKRPNDGNNPISQILPLTQPLRMRDCIIPPPPSLEESLDLLKLEAAMMALPAPRTLEIDEISALPTDLKIESIKEILKEINLFQEKSQNTNDQPTIAPIKK